MAESRPERASSTTESTEQAAEPNAAPRKPFTRPTVREAGRLEELTRQFGGTL